MIIPEPPFGDFSDLVRSRYRNSLRLAYVSAVILVLVALAIRLYLPASFGLRPMLLLFLFPVIVSAFLGGLWPGLLATLLSAIVSNFQLLPPYRSLAIAGIYDVVQWTLLIANGILISLLSEFLLRIRQRENAHWQQLLETRDQLRFSQTLFQTTFEQAAKGICLLAPDGRWLKVNRQFCEIVGYSQDELLTGNFSDIAYREDCDALLRLLTDEVDGFSGDKRVIRKNGSIVWVKLNASAARKPDGSPECFILLMEDIEQREQALLALHESETALKIAQRLAALGSWAWDLRTGELKWSEQIYNLFGRDPHLPPADYEEVARYFKPESWQRLQAAVAQACSDGVPYECEAELQNDGELHRWVVARGEPVRDEQANIVALYGTVQDITPRKQAELALQDAQRVALEKQGEARLAALNLMEDALTARKALEVANASLRESEEFKRAILDSVSANIAVLNRDGMIVSVNRPWQQFAEDDALACGQSADVCGIGTNYLRICQQASGPYRQGSLAVFTGLSAVLEGRLPRFRYEYACHSAQKQRWFAMVVTPLETAEGGAVVSHTNITERKLAEMALVESEERLRLAQSSANIGIWDWHIDNGKVQWTAELETMFGYAPGTFPGDYSAFSQRVHPDDLAELEHSRDSAVAAHRTFDFDFRVQPEPGQIRWLNCKGGANYDDRGRPQRVFGICIDITERKNTESELKLWAQAFENAEFGLAIADAQTNLFLAVNPVFAGERGYTAEELIGKPVAMVYPADLIDQVQHRISSLDTSCHGVFETEHQRKDGSRFPVMIDVTIIKSGDGKPLRRVAYALDISERKASELALREQTDALQRFNRAMVGREMDMIALKQQINELSRQHGQEQPYPLEFLDHPLKALQPGALP
ncbi:PAS domain S-box protein [Methylomonas sp. MO1]|uniref:PAS domain S-box protein n=1 Tax=Methylomonas sp. MO1 TaxID=3073619 RepID=UPI0028A553DB|nr:PAS domain S-box protein [Methylomonas sp. MO1]MDT4290935.1 PAS domain S-box protein [Methylomonas sp. MO1]